MSATGPFKVLHLIHSLEIGGAQKVIANLVKHHDRSRFIPMVGSLRRDGVLQNLMGSVGAEVVFFDKSSSFDFNCVARIRRFIREKGISLVNAHNFSASFWGRCACRGFRDVAFFITEHGRMGAPPLKLKFFNRLLAGEVDRIIAVSMETAQFLKKGYPYNASKIRTVVNGIDLTSGGWSRDRLTEQFGIPADAKVVINLAALTRVKNQAALIRSIAIAKNKIQDILLLLIGDGPLLGQLESLVEKLNLKKNVIFAGQRIDGSEALSACDLFCLTSKAEGTSIAALEAMAAGCPVLLTSVGGNIDLIVDGKEGLLVPPDDENAIAAGLEKILSNKEFARSLAKSASMKVASDFSAERMTLETEALYIEALTDMGIGE